MKKGFHISYEAADFPSSLSSDPPNFPLTGVHRVILHPQPPEPIGAELPDPAQDGACWDWTALGGAIPSTVRKDPRVVQSTLSSGKASSALFNSWLRALSKYQSYHAD